MNKWTAAPRDFEACAETFGAVALAAGAAILDVRARGPEARTKSDSSPVTDADERAESVIVEALRDWAPGLPVVAEESAARGAAGDVGDEFVLVDPLDGTREFIAGHDDFTVNIALVRRGAPVAGAVYAPALGKLWIGARACFAIDAPAGSTMPPRENWRRVRARAGDPDGLVALVSRSHIDERSLAALEAWRVSRRLAMGSSIKFCVLAEGGADVYPRFGPTMEWDTAAGDAVLRAAGGVMWDEAGEPIRYGGAGRGFRNGNFVAWGDPALAGRLMAGATGGKHT